MPPFPIASRNPGSVPAALQRAKLSFPKNDCRVDSSGAQGGDDAGTHSCKEQQEEGSGRQDEGSDLKTHDDGTQIQGCQCSRDSTYGEARAHLLRRIAKYIEQKGSRGRAERSFDSQIPFSAGHGQRDDRVETGVSDQDCEECHRRHQFQV